MQPLAEESNILGALLRLDLGRFIIPPSLGQSFSCRPLSLLDHPPRTHRRGIRRRHHQHVPRDRAVGALTGIRSLATYAVGWVPWVGWLSPQIMIFYNFGERIVESLVVNSANWLWGPLPFFEGLGNIAADSWDALVPAGN